MIRANLDCVAGNKNVAFVSTGDESVLKDLTAQIGKELVVGGNVLESANAVLALSDVDGVVFLEGKDKSKLNRIDEEVLRMRSKQQSLIPRKGKYLI